MPRTARGLQIRIGLLVLVALALGVGFVLFLTASRLGGSNLIFETYFPESVQGLDVGAPVRYRGVQIGRVTEISLASATYRRPEGEPFAGAFQLVLVRFAVDEQRLGDVPTMHEAVELGLRIRITAQGITGVNYLELDFVSPERFPALKVPWGPEFFHVPSIPSTAARVQSAAETLLQRLQETKLPELVDELAGLAVDLRAQLRDGDVAQALREAGQLMVALRTAAEGAALPQLSGDLRAALAEGQATLAETRRAVAELRTLLAGREARQTVANLAAASADLRTAIQRVPGSLAALDQTLRAARGSTVDLQAELVPLLRDLRATLANLRDTTEALRRAPSQAIFGAPPPADPRR